MHFKEIPTRACYTANKDAMALFSRQLVKCKAVSMDLGTDCCYSSRLMPLALSIISTFSTSFTREALYHTFQLLLRTHSVFSPIVFTADGFPCPCRGVIIFQSPSLPILPPRTSWTIASDKMPPAFADSASINPVMTCLARCDSAHPFLEGHLGLRWIQRTSRGVGVSTVSRGFGTSRVILSEPVEVRFTRATIGVHCAWYNSIYPLFAKTNAIGGVECLV